MLKEKRKVTDEQKKKLSESAKRAWITQCRVFTEEHKRRMSESAKCVWITKRQKAVIGEERIIDGIHKIRCRSIAGWLYWKRKKEIPPPPTVEQIEQMPHWMRYKYRKKGWPIPKRKAGRKRGYKESLSTRIKKSISHRRYLLDVRAIAREQKERIRKSIIYKLWRETVYKRDDWTCQKCGARSGNGHEVILEAHHEKSYTKYPALRFEPSNGITLCRLCHRKISSQQMMGNKNGRPKELPGITPILL